MALEIRRITIVTPDTAAAFAQLLPQLGPQFVIPSRDALQTVASSSCAALLGAYEGENMLGTLTLVWYDVPSGRKAWIEDVVVDASARGLSVGEKLVRAALEQAAQAGAGRVQLTSNKARQAAHALYRKVGFEESETSVFVFKISR